MSSPAINPGFFEPSPFNKRQLYVIGGLSALAIAPFVIWPRLSERLLATDFLPHLYCYLRNPAWFGPTWLQTR